MSIRGKFSPWWLLEPSFISFFYASLRFRLAYSLYMSQIPHFLPLTSGLHQHFAFGRFVFLQCGQGESLTLMIVGAFVLFILPFIVLLVFSTSRIVLLHEKHTCHIILLCSWTCKTFTNSSKVIVDQSFASSKAEIFTHFFLEQ